MRKIFLLVVLLFSTVFVFARKPEWLTNGYDRKYSPDKYLCGVGVGQTLDEARTNARAEISRIFRTTIAQTATNIQKETSSTSQKTETAIQTSVRTDEATFSVLEGIEITDTYFDKKQKTYYARASLNRQNAKKMIVQRMQEIDEEISKNFSASEKTASTLEKISLLQKVLKLQKEQEELARQRHILEAGYPGFIKLVNESVLEELKKKVKFTFSPKTSPELKPILAEKINSCGFVVVDTATISSESEPVIVVEAEIKISPSLRENPNWKFALWEIRQNLLVNNQNISGRYQKGEESQLTEEAARQRAQAKAEAVSGELILDQIQKDILKDSFDLLRKENGD